MAAIVPIQEPVNNDSDYDSENENTYTHIITPYHTTRKFLFY